jgi:hypothetical protein
MYFDRISIFNFCLAFLEMTFYHNNIMKNILQQHRELCFIYSQCMLFAFLPTNKNTIHSSLIHGIQFIQFRLIIFNILFDHNLLHPSILMLMLYFDSWHISMQSAIIMHHILSFHLQW